MDIFWVAGGVIFCFMCGVFWRAMAIKNNGVVDVAYGLAFILATLVTYVVFAVGHPRQVLVLLLIVVWGLRLALHIHARNKGRGEDFRYRAWREEWGDTFVWRSFLQIYMLQGAVIWVVLAPVVLVVNDAGAGLGVLDVLGVLVWLVGFGFEALGDWQLLCFKRNPDNKGRLMTEGLWRFTRHPNYFGEATLWWGLFLIALNVPYGWLAIVSPVTIDFLLLKVSGIPMLEAKYEGNAEFESYKARTNAFFPWFPRKD